MDNVEDNLPRGFSSIKPEKVELPNAPRAARGPDVSDDRIPKEPPFTAYIANLSYEVNTEVVNKFYSFLKDMVLLAFWGRSASLSILGVFWVLKGVIVID